MKRIIAIILCLSACACMLCSCSDEVSFSKSDNLINKYERSDDAEKTYNYGDGAVNAPGQYAAFSNEITDLALRMFRNYNKSTGGGSYVFSPASAALQLGLISCGASGETSETALNALSKSLKQDEMNQCMSYFKSRLEKVASVTHDDLDSVTGENNGNDQMNFVKLSTNLFVNDISDVKTKFIQTDRDYYGCNLFRFMFDDENALAKANSLFRDFGTEKAFEKLDGNQTLVSVTAADICDTWLNAYAVTDLAGGNFKAGGTEKEIAYMSSAETYMHTDKAQAVMKYTNSTPLKLMFILPNEDISLDSYIADLTNSELGSLLDSVDFSKNANAVIPEFKIESPASAQNITEVLENSGLYMLFGDNAEFDNLTRSDDFKLNAAYELAPQFSVNACGVGGVYSNGDSPALKQHTAEKQKTDVTVTFNRPFIFLVLDNESNIPLYAGTYRG